MKAEEYLERNEITQKDLELYTWQGIADLLKDYGKQVCKEQREICNKIVLDDFLKHRDSVILRNLENAPEPEL